MTTPHWYAFEIPSFVDGVARLADFAGVLEVKDYDFRVSDSAALASDFAAVGWDLGEAIVEASEDERLSA